jgi:hypothetical protein
MPDQISANLPTTFGKTGMTIVAVDTIAEFTPAAGVTVDGVLLKDGGVTGTIVATTMTATTITGTTANHLSLNTESDDKQVRINSRNFTQASGDSIGFQSKPNQTIGSSGSVFGGQISPRVASGVALSGSGSIIGLHVDVNPKGTAAGTVGGDIRALNLELVTDDAATRTVTGNLNFIRMRAAFSGTVSGTFVPIRIEKAETQTGSLQYAAILDLPSTLGTGATTIWTDAGVSSATNAGCIAVLVNGNKRYINLFSGTPA